ncbi:major facilitator superfamily domain-containing protein [Penicillium canariense]|uniref:Major facilitator superfamily domain-containing protein n=1 Tax=Penicillium canariense TaxID=189055 RepID=A0A9W9LHE6_9EURO|nr:major facilitator superfamily domain-containing protein [Penicillium canariense]KAJ5157256.1 major facilitator superfamily domain-containing protein [Penicillium canariense]
MPSTVVESSDSSIKQESVGQGLSKELALDSASSGGAPSKNSEVLGESIKAREREYITGFKLVMVLVGVTSVMFLVLLDTSIIVTAIPVITTQFHSLEDLGWYGSSYQIASACLQPLAGTVYTNFRTKWTFLSFFFVFELGSLFCGLATSSKMLIVARAVAGLGSAGLMNGGLTIVSSSVPFHKSPPLIGMMMGFCQLGVVLGPLLGGAFTEYTTWRWCFYINLPIGALVAFLLAFTDIPEQAAKPPIKAAFDTITRKLDLIGFALLAPAAIQLLLALEYGQNEYPWNSATVIGLFCGAGATFILFLFWENYQGEKAMIPLSMVAKRNVWSSCLVILSISAIALISSYYLPLYFQAIKNDSPMMSGVYLLPSILSQVAMAVISGALIGKMGYYLPWAVACGVLSSIGNGLLSTLAQNTSTGKWVGYQIIAGAGRGAGFQTPLIAVQNTLPPSQISVGMSILMFAQTLSGAIFLTFADVIFSTGLKSTIPKDAPNVNPQVVIAAGATGIRDVVSNQDLPGVLKAYAKSVDHGFYMSAALGVCCLIFAFGMGWEDVRKKKPAGEQV